MNPSHINTSPCTQINELISGYIDNELSQQQLQMVSLHLESCAECRQTMQDLNELKQRTGQMKMPQLETETLKELLNESTSKSLATFGYFALGIGLLGLVIFHWISLWQDTNTPALVKILLTLVEAGGLLLFFSVLRQRLISTKTDRYNDVQL